ncbi:MAG: penicillin amidase [Myxococcota bacterium]
MGFLQSWNLQDNLGVELAAWAMRDKWDAAMLDRLFALDDTVPPIEDRWETLRTQAVTGALTSPFKAWTGALGGRPDGAEASNNWVVGPSRTASGKPILANDPHLGQSVPSLWYVADVSGGDMHVAGATLPGLFGVPIGHNERVAWGLTNLMADVVDVAVLERVGDDAVRIRGETVPLESAVVRIVVKGGDPVRRTVYRTPIGPVISELEGTHVLVLRWHALELEDDLAGVVHGLAHSKSASSLVEIADSALMVAQGVVIADVDGDWGYQYVGSVPVRSAHSGRVPHDGSASGWDGWFASLPGEHAPERGWVVTANARPTHDRSWNDEKEPIQVDAIGSGWVPPHRAGRLAELLEATEGATPADMSAMQLDLLDPVARDRLPALLEGVTPSEVAKPCTDVLAAWDHTMAADSAGAAVWTRLQTSLTRAALADDLSAEGLAMYLSATGPSRTLLAAGKLEGWMDDRVATVSTALDEACRRVIAVHGVDPAGWRWGDAHPLRLEHRFASGRDMLAEWNMREVPFGGNGATVAAAGHGWLGDERPVGGMASLRLVVPLDDVGAATLVHPGGQAGQPKSPFYASHFDAFVAGETVPLWFDDDDVGRESVWSITLAP